MHKTMNRPHPTELFTHTHTHTHTHAHAHTNTHTHAHAHTHTQTETWKKRVPHVNEVIAQRDDKRNHQHM